ncbi:MAG: hypothetical protein U0790_01010 [Isosphaeraceae bacterium]
MSGSPCARAGRRKSSRSAYLFQMTAREIALHLAVSPGTVQADLAYARAWLRRDLGPTIGPPPG